MHRPLESLAVPHLDPWSLVTTYPGAGREPIPFDGADVLLGGLSVDQHLARVGREIRARGASTATLHADIDVAGGRGLTLRPPVAVTCGAVFMRSVDFSLPIAHHGRASFVVVDPFDPNDALHDHAAREAAAAIDGWTELIDAPRWVNDPWANRRADSKALQLRVASAHGLRIPRTIVTTSRDEATAFALTCGRIVHKSMRHPMVAWPDAAVGFLHTSPVLAESLGDPGATFPHPVLLQEQLAAQAEYRSTVVGERVFTVRLERQHGGTESGIDWRRGLAAREVRVVPATLEPDEERALCSVVADVGLRFAAIDLLEVSDGTRYFLEVNPTGSFGWVEEAAGLPITGAIVDDLLEPTR